MNFTSFPVSGTNIFPCANTTKGGQLMTEFNLRSRESVGVDEAIQYMVGLSYVHGESDFYVRPQSSTGTFFPGTTSAGNSVLEILEGRGVINGHFVELLVPLYIDLLAANAAAAAAGEPTLSGELVVGLRIMYSTEATMAGTIMVENSNEMYEGVQVVILPAAEFKMPVDVPTDPSAVTAHIKLATFNFYNGVISNVANNYPAKCTMFPASRIQQVENLMSDMFVRKTGLNPKKLYTFAGKGVDPATGLDTWCDSTGSLMMWDNLPQLVTNEPAVAEASFMVMTDGSIRLVVPHKQPEYDISTTGGVRQYYADKMYSLPKADFAKGTSGTVDASYTNSIKKITNMIHDLYNLPDGQQRAFIEILNSVKDLPPLNPLWTPGDYILVGQDNTLNNTSDMVRPPSTIYVVLPGVVTSIVYSSDPLTGVEVGSTEGTTVPDTTISANYNSYWDFANGGYRGIVGTDYFAYYYTNPDTGEVTVYKYAVATAAAHAYSSAVMITGEIPLAQTRVIGGFLNVDETATDYGYVYLDSDGHLRLLDYALLRSGTLAYQLCEDFTTPAGLTTSEVQAYLNEYVNTRVAFPNFNHTQTAANPNVIHIYINLVAETKPATIDLYDLDSRFNTSVYVHILGTADNNTTINISDCQKVRIDSNVGGSPIINIYRSTLYYDADVLNRLNTIRDLRLWYQKFESTDPNLVVDSMTVRAINQTIIATGVDWWNDSTPNDNHFTFALKDLTFGSDGTITGCTMLVRNDMTTNVQTGKYIIASGYTIPQGVDLIYPISRLNQQIKVTGQFVAAYTSQDPAGYLVEDTSFTMLSQTYDPTTMEQLTPGTISFLVDASYVTNVTGLPIGTPIDGWEPNSFHAFSGATIS